MEISDSLVEKIFEEIVSDSTWGSSWTGGPLWVLDFRFNTLRERFSGNEIIRRLNSESDDSSQHYLSAQLAELADEYIKYHQLCNVLVVRDGWYYTPVYFYSLFSFVNLLNKVLGRNTEKGAELRDISYILSCQSPLIKNDDYIWRTEWHVERFEYVFPDYRRKGQSFWFDDGKVRFMFLPYAIPQFVKLVDIKRTMYSGEVVSRQEWQYTRPTVMVKSICGWEQYIGLIVYDLMELLSMNYFEEFGFYKKGELQYPCASYGAQKTMWLSNRKIYDMPKPKVLCESLWHRSFKPELYWEMRDDTDCARFLV